MGMDSAAILDAIAFYTLLLGMPSLAVVMLLLTFVHQSEQQQQREEAMHKVRERAQEAARARTAYARLLDPIFRFRPPG